MKKSFLSLSVLLALTVTACDKIPANLILPSQNSTNKNTNQANTEKVVISGLVQDDNNQPVNEAVIVIKDDNKIIGTTKTNEKGEFSISVPKTFGDSYFVEAKKELTDASLNQTLLITSDQKASFTGDNRLRKTVIASKPVPVPAE